MTTCDTIHGFQVVRSHPTPKRSMTRAGRVVLVDRGEQMGEAPRYVTAWQGKGDDEWWQGRYFRTLPEAETDFATRVARGW
jgi:hypothetical protein